MSSLYGELQFLKKSSSSEKKQNIERFRIKTLTDIIHMTVYYDIIFCYFYIKKGQAF